MLAVQPQANLAMAQWDPGVHQQPDGHQHPDGGPVSYVHSAIDAHSRLAYSEIHDDERGPTCAAFWTRAQAFYAAHHITVEAVLTDNAKNYLGLDFTAA